MTDILVKMMVGFLCILALATKQIKQGHPSRFILMWSMSRWNAEKFVKKVLGENDLRALLHKLDRLTLNESWILMAAAETLRVVHDLVQHMGVVMNGEKTQRDLFLTCLSPSTRPDLDGKASARILWVH